MDNVTHILSAIEQGDRQAAEQLLPLVYEELRKLAAQKMAQDVVGTPGHGVNRVIVVKDGAIIFDTAK